MELSDAWITSLVALAGAVLVALWNVGGWAAVQRRTMRQELEIANSLRPGLERQRIEEVALERATLYAYRRTFIGPSPIRLRRLVMATLMLPVVFGVTFTMAELGAFFWLALNLEVFVFSGLMAFWVIRAMRVLWARSRRKELGLARERLNVPSAAWGISSPLA